jgi:hypothetical protein
VEHLNIWIVKEGSEVFTAVTMKNAVFWDVMQCISCMNRRFGGTCRLVTANVVPNTSILFTLMIEAILSSET